MYACVHVHATCRMACCAGVHSGCICTMYNCTCYICTFDFIVFIDISIGYRFIIMSTIGGGVQKIVDTTITSFRYLIVVYYYYYRSGHKAVQLISVILLHSFMSMYFLNIICIMFQISAFRTDKMFTYIIYFCVFELPSRVYQCRHVVMF